MHMAERLFRIKVVDFRFIQQWAVDEFTTDIYGLEKSPYQLEVARVWSWPTQPQRDYFDQAGEHLQINVLAVVAFFWPPPGWKAPKPSKLRVQRHRSFSFDSDDSGSVDGDAGWTQRRVSAKRYVLNMDLRLPVDNLPDVTSDLWLDVFDRPSKTAVVFHPRTKGKWTEADLARVRATVTCVIEHALGCSSLGGDVTLVGTEHLPAAVFPLQKLVWSDGGIFGGELAEVDTGKLAAVKSVEAVLAAAGDRHPVELHEHGGHGERARGAVVPRDVRGLLPGQRVGEDSPAFCRVESHGANACCPQTETSRVNAAHLPVVL